MKSLYEHLFTNAQVIFFEIANFTLTTNTQYIYL